MGSPTVAPKAVFDTFTFDGGQGAGRKILNKDRSVAISKSNHLTLHPSGIAIFHICVASEAEKLFKKY